jgi:lipid A 3-O-deacylase
LRPILRGALALAALLLPVESRGEALAGPTAPSSYGAQQVALLAGGGFGLRMFGNRDQNEDQPRIFGVFGRWAIGLSDPLALGTFYTGNVELDVEPMLLLNYQPRSGWAAGGSLLLHYNFLDEGAIVPFIEGGAGVSHLDFDLDSQSDGFTFPLQASLGFHAFASPRAAVTASVGYYHLSNARLRDPNAGINALMVRIGATFFP